MTLIFLHNDFLPTDTVSAVALDAANPFLLLVGVFLMLYPPVWIAYIFGGPKLVRLIVGLLVFVGGVFVVLAGSGNTFEYNESVKASTEKNITNFVSNIESAYDVEVVLPKVEDYSVSPEEKASITAIQDGIGYEALVAQNPDTYEPTLIMIASEASNIQEFRKK